MTNMPNKIFVHRAISPTLAVLGVLLMLLAPETWYGLIVLGAGISIELAGIYLRNRWSR